MKCQICDKESNVQCKTCGAVYDPQISVELDTAIATIEKIRTVYDISNSVRNLCDNFLAKYNKTWMKER